ncbi:uncharacterized protein LOC131429058 [Malaya genurostris]|uniref:uncharacterized protein LOC131429058 n=1 Tax=Malaya genurostris TaxID=325434 RepID=UPI0026F407FF|nr:uncharacterized protein LOC131429058 [Malaya genurostris]
MLQFVPTALREKMLQEKSITLDDVVRQVNAYETSRSASEQISGKSILQQAVGTEENVQFVRKTCKYCGRSHGPNQECPARDKTCSVCGKRGHFHAVCYSRNRNNSPANKSTVQPDNNRGHSNRKVHAIEQYDTEDANDEVELVDMVSSANDSDDLIWARVGGVLIEMQIDSGVKSNIIDFQTWEKMLQNGVRTIGKFQRNDRRFKVYAQKDCLVVATMFDAEIKIEDHDKQMMKVARFYVKIAFRDGVEVKLKELLTNDIIEKVSEPSRWVSPMVIVAKDCGNIRLCIDMRQLNKAILRETHPLPTIEDIRWKLNGAVFFSRLDIKDAFHQLELDDESKPLTTFIAHKGKLISQQLSYVQE